MVEAPSMITHPLSVCGSGGVRFIIPSSIRGIVLRCPAAAHVLDVGHGLISLCRCSASGHLL